MKKVVILLIVAVAAGVAVFFVARDALHKSQVHTRCDELGGLVSSSGEHIRNALERDWWHEFMPATWEDYPQGEFSPDIVDVRGKNEWFRQWQDENTEHGGQGVRRVVGKTDVEFLDQKHTLQTPRRLLTGVWKVRVTWHLGVPNSNWGEKVTYEMWWQFDDLFWRLLRIWEVARNTDAGPPPAKD
jgi:hypothetical protein